jgi:hypothetical protein
MNHLKGISLDRMASCYSLLRTWILNAKRHELDYLEKHNQTFGAESMLFAQGVPNNNNFGFVLQEYEHLDAISSYDFGA